MLDLFNIIIKKGRSITLPDTAYWQSKVSERRLLTVESHKICHIKRIYRLLGYNILQPNKVNPIH